MAQCAPAGSRARGTSMGGLYVTAALLALLASGAVCCFAFVDHHFVSFRLPNCYFMFPPCVLAVSFWFPHGLRFPIGFHMVSLLISPGFHMVSLLFLHGFHLVPIWFPLGFLLVSGWFPRGFLFGFHMVSLRFPSGFHLVPLWFPFGFLAGGTWFPYGFFAVSIQHGNHMESLWLLCGFHRLFSTWLPSCVRWLSCGFRRAGCHVAFAAMLVAQQYTHAGSNGRPSAC